jgi:nitric-oxide synthase, bacterial
MIRQMKHIEPREAGDRGERSEEARRFLDQYEREIGVDMSLRRRVASTSLATAGSYWPTTDELTFAAKLAWRNSNRCVGRLYWKTLKVLDRRDAATAADVFAACLDHLKLATNGGRVQPVLTVFPPLQERAHGIHIWNPQLIRYAGFAQADGTVIGDPLNTNLTSLALGLGWKPTHRGPFTVLPLIIQFDDLTPQLFELPSEAVLEVEIAHPEISAFSELGLRWHAVPAVSDMRLEAAGITYTAAPFNGWYMGTEIGARNFGDESRFDLLPKVADLMGLDRRTDRTLWKDKALVELNVAVLHSYRAAGVTIIDHHAATKHFMRHIELERSSGRDVNADWSWIVPPMNGSTTPVFHRYYPDKHLRPAFENRA